MKRIIICLAFFSIIFCTAESCDDEEDATKCSTHTIEYNGFSCRKFSYVNSDETGCTPFPDNAGSQKGFLNIMNGMTKELFSGIPTSLLEVNGINELPQFSSNKESYSKGEEINLTLNELTRSDINLIYSKSTCSYYFYGKVWDYLMDFQKNISNYKGYPNITDKNLCFNVKQFSDLKDLVDCGYAEIKYKSGNKEYEVKTCFYIPNNKMPEELGKYLKAKFIDTLMEDDGAISQTFQLIEQYDEMAKTLKEANANRRAATIKPSYEIVVENKDGKKVKWTDTSSDVEVIDKGNDSNMFKLNIILLLSLLLFY